MRFSTKPATKLDALVNAAEKEPVFIDRGKDEVAVILSAREYDRLTGVAIREFQDFCDAVSDHAEARGLTEAKLNQLLEHAW